MLTDETFVFNSIRSGPCSKKYACEITTVLQSRILIGDNVPKMHPFI